MDDMHLLFYHLDCHVLVINGEFITKNKLINIWHYYVPIEKSKYEATHYGVMIDSSNAIHHTIISTDNCDDKTHMNPAEIIYGKK